MKKFTKFQNHNNYLNFIESTYYLLPNISLCYDNNSKHIHYERRIDIPIHDYSQDYLTIVSLEDNNTIGWKAKDASNLKTINVSTDNGQTWTDKESSIEGTTLATLNNGDKLLIKGSNTAYGTSSYYNYFTATQNFNVSGNIMSLLYDDNFIGETSLSGKDYAFFRLFYNNTYLVNAQNLIFPATTLAISCYSSMFWGCTSLTTAPALPATTLAGGCYTNMFYGCTSLTTAPELPVTTLANNCYGYMFASCTSLTTAPELPATTLATYCYYGMFFSCSSLTTAPALPATTLSFQCYFYMFTNCTSLTATPILPATTLAQFCYAYMFYGCTSLITTPELPATTLADYCYMYMFNGCSSLIIGPELPATTLTNNCYVQMFNNCSSLKYIKCLANGDTSSISTQCGGWVVGVNNYGIFEKSSLNNNWPINDVSGIPSGWVVINEGELPMGWNNNNYTYYNGDINNNLKFINPFNLPVTFSSSDNSVATINSSGNITNISIGTCTLTASFAGNNEYDPQIFICQLTISYDYSKDYLTIVSRADNNAIGWKASNSSNLKTISVSTDNGQTWTDKESSTSGTTLATLNNGDKLLIKGSNTTYSTGVYYNYFTSTQNFDVSGNIMSLLYGDNFMGETSLSGKNYAFMRLFYNNTYIVNAQNLKLPATTLATSCYYYMFQGCTSLTNAPALPATTLANECYGYMFYGCTSLTSAPALPATTLIENCYMNMFYGCTSLNYIKCLATNISASNCTYHWVYNVAYNGLFIKNSNMNSWTTGENGIPTYWTINDGSNAPLMWSSGNNYFTYINSDKAKPMLINPYNLPITYSSSNSNIATIDNSGNIVYVSAGSCILTASFAGNDVYDSINIELNLEISSYNYKLDYLTIEPIANGTVSFSKSGLEYSINNGTTWTSLEANTNINVTIGNNILFRGTLTPGNSASTFGIGTFSSSNNINVYGNINSLLYGVNYKSYDSTAIKYAAFTNLFKNCTHLIDASNLMLSNGSLNYVCYKSMFEGCSSLIKGPTLPTISISSGDSGYNVYHSMFKNCTSLEEAPEIKLTSIGGTSNNPLGDMFYGCSSLNFIKLLVTSGHTTANLSNWTYGVASTGTFIKADNEVWETGTSGIPTGWTAYNESDYHNSRLSWSSNTYTAILGTTYNYPTLSNPNNLTITYSSSDTSIATIDSSGNITLTNTIGSTIISAIFAGDSNYESETITYTLTVIKQTIQLEWSVISNEITILTTYRKGYEYNIINPSNVQVTYSSSNTSVATIDNNGDITIQGVGSTVMTVLYAGDANTNSASDTFTLTITKVNAGISWSANSITITENVSYSLPALSNPNSLTGITYNSSNTSIATIDSSGNITLVGFGNTTISATYAGDSIYNSSTVSYQLTYQEYQKENPTLQWSAATYSLFINETYNGPTLSVTSGLTITYSSSDTTVATIDSNGNVTLIGDGTAIITASFTGNQYYNSASDSYTLTVSKVNANIAWSANTFNSTIINPSYPTLSNPNNLTVTYSSSNTSIATIDSSGNISYVGEGTCTLTATFAGNSIYNSSTVTCQLTLVNRNYAQEYLTFTALENTTFTFTEKGSGNSLEYSLDNGTTWNELESGNSTSTISSGDSIIWRGARDAGSSSGNRGIGKFSSTGRFDASGNILSLLYGDNFTNYTSIPNDSYCFYELFNNCTKIVNTEHIIMSDNTYEHCYESMFYGCTALTTTPVLPATTLARNCYDSMFRGCIALTTAPALPATTLAQNCYTKMFRGCTSLTTTPVLSAAMIENYSYEEMFRGCTNLNMVTCLATDITTVQYPMSDWLRDVASTGTFYKDPLMSSWPTGTSGIPTGWTVMNYGSSLPLTWSANAYNCAINEASPTYPTLTNPENLTVTYSSSDTLVATISSSGVITIQGIGETTISAVFAGNGTYESGSVSYTLTITKANPNIAWSTNIASVLLNDTFNAPTLSNPNSLTITYSSSDTSIATINSSTGVITILDEGTTNISAIFAGNNIYNASTVTYTLEVLAAGVIHDWGTDAANEYTPYTGRSYITDISNIGSSSMTLNYVKPDGSSSTISSNFLKSTNSYGNPSQGLTGFNGWISHYITNDKTIAWDDVSSSDWTILTTWENTANVKVDYGWMSDMSVSSQSWGDKWTTKKIAAFKNCNLLGIIVMDGSFIKWGQYSNISVKAWNGSETTVDGRPCVSFNPNTTVGADGILIAIVYTEA